MPQSLELSSRGTKIFNYVEYFGEQATPYPGHVPRGVRVEWEVL